MTRCFLINFLKKKNDEYILIHQDSERVQSSSSYPSSMRTIIFLLYNKHFFVYHPFLIHCYHHCLLRTRPGFVGSLTICLGRSAVGFCRPKVEFNRTIVGYRYLTFGHLIVIFGHATHFTITERKLCRKFGFSHNTTTPWLHQKLLNHQFQQLKYPTTDLMRIWTGFIVLEYLKCKLVGRLNKFQMMPFFAVIKIIKNV